MNRKHGILTIRVPQPLPSANVQFQCINNIGIIDCNKWNISQSSNGKRLLAASSQARFSLLSDTKSMRWNGKIKQTRMRRRNPKYCGEGLISRSQYRISEGVFPGSNLPLLSDNCVNFGIDYLVKFQLGRSWTCQLDI